MTGGFLAFLGVSAVVIMTPGQDTVLTIRNTLTGGRTGGIGTAVGVAAGLTTWAVLTSLGLGALLVASEPAFLALKLAGAIYLLFLGAQSLNASMQRAKPRSLGVPAVRHRELAVRTTARQGVVSNLTNPKVLAFFSSLLPQFARTFTGLLGLGLLFSMMTLAWLVAYATAVDKAAPIVQRPGVQRTIEGVAGVSLIGIGLHLAVRRA
jgi:threonine/homoserine/homoserine lactone efflux protein